MSELFDINYYCRIYDNFLDDEICDTYVQYFEETLEKDADEVKKTSICIGRTRPDGHQICGNCNCQRLNPMGFSRFDYFNDIAIKKFQQATEQYKKDISPEDLIKDAENIFKFVNRFENVDYENTNLEGLEDEIKNLSNNMKEKYKDYMSEEDYKDLEEDLDFEEQVIMY